MNKLILLIVVSLIGAQEYVVVDATYYASFSREPKKIKDTITITEYGIRVSHSTGETPYRLYHPLLEEQYAAESKEFGHKFVIYDKGGRIFPADEYEIEPTNEVARYIYEGPAIDAYLYMIRKYYVDKERTKYEQNNRP